MVGRWSLERGYFLDQVRVRFGVRFPLKFSL